MERVIQLPAAWTLRAEGVIDILDLKTLLKNISHLETFAKLEKTVFLNGVKNLNLQKTN